MAENEFQTFLEKYPSYKKTESIDELRKTDYVRLDYGEHVYLDYTGGGIYAESQIEKHHQLLHNNVFGNPHSTNPTSQAATHLVEGARDYILKFFNADPNEYLAIFTSTASATVKKGTRARMVVNVRLLAVRPRLSSRKRSRKVWAVVFQGKRERSATSASRRCTPVCRGKGMVAMMPSP